MFDEILNRKGYTLTRTGTLAPESYNVKRADGTVVAEISLYDGQFRMWDRCKDRRVILSKTVHSSEGVNRFMNDACRERHLVLAIDVLVHYHKGQRR